MVKHVVEVIQYVEVELDETKFDEAFMEEFRAHFYRFNSLEDHAEHIGQLAARGIIDGFPSEFIEGYGLAHEMGIKTNVIDTSVDLYRE